MRYSYLSLSFLTTCSWYPGSVFRFTLFLTYILNECFSQILSLHIVFLQELVAAYCFIVSILTITTFFYCFHSFLRSFGIGIEVAGAALFVLTFIRIFSSKTFSESTVLCFNAFFWYFVTTILLCKVSTDGVGKGTHPVYLNIFSDFLGAVAPNQKLPKPRGENNIGYLLPCSPAFCLLVFST